MRILLTSGGSGGHIFPLISVARELKKIAPNYGMYDLEFLYFGASFEEDLGKEIIEKEGIKFKKSIPFKIRRYFALANIVETLFLPFSFFYALFQIFLFMPDVVFGKGGGVTIPIIIISWLFRIPIIIHDSDAIPGKANQFLAKFASKIAISFETARKYFPKNKTALTGNPIRMDILNGSKEMAKKIFGIKTEKPVILIMGGSQGAEKINTLISAILGDLLSDYEIIHICGTKHYDEILKEVKILFIPEILERYHLFPFLKDELMHAYAICDLIISRAGAGSIFEIAALGKPSIIVPIPNSANDHQLENAYEYAKYGATVVLEESNLIPHMLLQKINLILKDKELAKEMSQSAKKFASPQAAQIIAQEIIRLGKA